MKSLWSDKEAKKYRGDLATRVYTSRLLGADPELVLHGGGNTSVKICQKDFFGKSVDVLHVKGSGWDLGTIEKGGFAPVRMDTLLQMAELEQLSDIDMVTHQRAAMLNPDAPTPSIEAIVHAVIPHKFVDHTHANAVLALTNHQGGSTAVEEVYGSRLVVIPYVMPGFALARAVHQAMQQVDDPAKLDGMILMNHGIFTFHQNAQQSYELMIELVTLAEKFLAKKSKGKSPSKASRIHKPAQDLLQLAELRHQVSIQRGCAVYAKINRSREAVGFSKLENASSLATRGPLTPDHVIRTKRIALVHQGDDPRASVDRFAADYRLYFDQHNDGSLTMLDPAPRWAVWPGHGTLAFGASLDETAIIGDIIEHTVATIQQTENAFAGGWEALPAADIFAIEYWELEQAKLRKNAAAKAVHQGKVALVTGAAGGIGFACAEALAQQGAKVVALDLNPDIVPQMEKIGADGLIVNLTDGKKVLTAVEETVCRYGGIDILVSNAGVFTAGQYLDQLETSNWDLSLAVNLSSHQKLLKYTIPYLKKGIAPAIVMVGSRNVKAPGAGAASYSCAKAGLTQLCRVAALELAPAGVRCNIVHPDAVFDTKIWTPEVLARSAERYGISVAEYKARNLLKTEITSRNVGEMVAAMASPLFSKTTGAQIPVDGGNDRVL